MSRTMTCEAFSKVVHPGNAIRAGYRYGVRANALEKDENGMTTIAIYGTHARVLDFMVRYLSWARADALEKIRVLNST